MAISSEVSIKAYQLRFGVRVRMAILKAIAADSVNNRNESTRLNPGDWRAARHYKMHTYEAAHMCGLHGGSNPDGRGSVPVWGTHSGEYFRNERDADAIVHSLPSGWFTDTDANETAVGIVASLLHGRFIAGYRWTANDGRVYFGEVYTDENDAAYAADSHAESFAELYREHSERFDAVQDAESNCEDLAQRLTGLIPGRNASAFIRDSVRDIIATLREAREALADANRAYERG